MPNRSPTLPKSTLNQKSRSSSPPTNPRGVSCEGHKMKEIERGGVSSALGQKANLGGAGGVVEGEKAESGKLKEIENEAKGESDDDGEEISKPSLSQGAALVWVALFDVIVILTLSIVCYLFFRIVGKGNESFSTCLLFGSFEFLMFQLFQS